MTAKVKNHKGVEDDYVEKYINENCFYCSIELIRIEDILVECEKDRYLCVDCAEKYDLDVVECMEY